MVKSWSMMVISGDSWDYSPVVKRGWLEILYKLEKITAGKMMELAAFQRVS